MIYFMDSGLKYFCFIMLWGFLAGAESTWGNQDVEVLRTDGATLIRWPCVEGTARVAVKRRLIGVATGEWVTVNTQVLSPSVSTNRVWTSWEPRTQEHAYLTQRTIELLEAGRIQERTEAEFSAWLADATPPERKIITYETFANWTVGMVLGYSCVDRGVTTTGTYEYAVFTVHTNGVVSPEPLGNDLCVIESVAEQWLDLYISSDSGTNALLWLPRIWPEDVIAIQPKRWDGSAWEPVTTAYVEPDLSTNRNWSSTGLPESEQLRLRALRNALVADGEYDEINVDDFRDILSSVGRHDLAGLRIDMRYDYDRALVQGFACVDTNSASAVQYGLFAVYTNGTLSALPIAVQDVVSKAAFAPKFSSRRSRDAVELRWQASREIVDAVGVFGFRVRRAPLAEPSQIELISQGLVTGGWPENDQIIWIFDDRIASADEDYRYTIEAVDLFQKTFGDWTVDYIAASNVLQDPPLSDFGLISVKQIALADAAALDLEWKATTNASSAGLTFGVLRMDEVSGAWTNVVEELPASIRSYVDNTVTWGRRYRYRVLAVFDGDVVMQSNISFAEVRDYRKLEAPTGFSAAATNSNGSWSAQLSWEAVESATGYYIYTDRTGFGKQRLAIPLIEETECEVELGRRPNGGTFTFWVAPVSARRVIGEETETTVDLSDYQ